jgi:ATP-dependent helicase/nuclease subunit B
MIADSLVLTPNHRLSHYLQIEHATKQSASGACVFTRPHIVDWQTWLEQLWQKASALPLNLPYKLTPAGAKALWQSTLAHSTRGIGLLHAETTFDLAFKAWNLVQQWGAPIIPNNLCITEELEAYQHWQHDYQAVLTEKNWLDPAQLGAALTRLLPQLSPLLPTKICLMQFVDMTPEQHLFFNTLRALGHQLESTDSLPHGSQKNLIACLHPEDELTLMATWAKHQIGKPTTPQRIACIVPNLAERRSEIETLFTELLPGQFDISAAPALSDYPVVTAALDFLSLSLDRIPWPLLSRVLRSIFLGGSEAEYYSRAELDAQLRELSEPAFTNTDLHSLLAQTNKNSTLLKHLAALIATPRPPTASTAVWAELFTQQLQQLGWPGSRLLTSIEYQTVSRFTQALQEFRQLATILPELPHADALKQLRQLLQDISFQPQKAKQPVQVLGLLEAAGLPFDAIWLLGMNDETWPSSASPNPFLPLGWQRQLQFPHASNQRELTYCKQLQTQFESCSPYIIASFSQQEGDRPQKASPLVSNYKITTPAELSLHPLARTLEQVFQARALETYESERVRALPLSTTLRGGSSLLKLQAACPFRAFARFRLQATSLAGTTIGQSALERGLILHRALELIWKKIQSQAALLLYSDEGLQAEITDAISASLQPYLQKSSRRITRGQLALEQARLQKLLFTWLNLEKTRAPFVVFAQESRQEMQLGPYRLQLQIDRIDQLPDKRFIMIDYKTGRSQPADWFGERPAEPQLPLYSLCYPGVAGLSFAQVRSDDLGFKAVCEDPTLLPGAMDLNYHCEQTTTWQAQQQQWQQHLIHLLDEYYQGIATVTPQTTTACQTCEFHGLCRIHE